MMDYADAVNGLYGRGDLITRVFEALRKAGQEVDNLTVEVLGPIDELHIGGRQHTIRLGHMAGLSEGLHVIDVGCGIGGPARALAHHFGCRVTGIDCTQEFCSVGRILTGRTGLGQKVQILHGNALDLPFEEHAFDVAWMQHVAVNIPDKARLFKEMGRVLRPRGKIALYEILAGPEPAVHFPLPWACDPTLNLLVTEQEFQGCLHQAGFMSDLWEDITQESTDYLNRAMGKAGQQDPMRLSPAVVRGPDFPLMLMNLLRNLKEDRLRVVQGVLTLGS